MNTEIQDTSETRKVITAQFTAEEVGSIAEEVTKAVCKSAQMPGFRPGKAPAAMVKKRYAKHIIEELSKRLASKAHEDAVKGADFDVFEIISVDVSEDAASTVTFTVDVMPSFELPDYKSIQVESIPADITDADVDEALDRIRGQRAEFNVVERAAAKGDYVRCSYEGKVDDQLISEIAPDAALFGTQNSTWEEAGSTTAPGVPAVVEGVIGMKPGDEKTVSHEFSADFEVSALAGKTATYSVKVEEVRERVLPPIDQAFLDSLKVESEEALRQQLRDDLGQRKASEGARMEREQIAEKLLAAVDFPLPEKGLERETESVLRDFMQQNMRRGATQEDFEKNKEALYEGAAKAAHSRMKNRFILFKIAEKEKIEVKNEDLSNFVIQQAMAERVKPEQLVKELRKDQARLNDLRRDILLGKTMAFLHTNAKGEQKPTSDEQPVAEPSSAT